MWKNLSHLDSELAQQLFLDAILTGNMVIYCCAQIKGGIDMGVITVICGVIGSALLVYLFYILFRGEKA
jgi:hypothetical protein